jgi:hypothetical protein
LGITDEVEFYKDADGIMAMGIMSTPALVIDNKIYSMGASVSRSEQAKELDALRLARELDRRGLIDCEQASRRSNPFFSSAGFPGCL